MSSLRSALLEEAREKARAWRRLGFESLAEKIEQDAYELDDRLSAAEEPSDDR